MNWGNKILITYIAFAALIGTLVYKCMNQNVELVSADYYNEELKFQDKIDGNKNANRFSLVEIDQNEDAVTIRMPKEMNGDAVSGEAWFYCAGNSKNDRKIPVQVDSKGMMRVDKSTLAKSSYLVKLSWRNGSERFYNEQTIRVQ